MLNSLDYYEAALADGWTQEIEDCIIKHGEWTVICAFFSNISGANLVRVINLENSYWDHEYESDKLLYLKHIIDKIVYGVNFSGIISALKESDLDNDYKKELIKYAESKLIERALV